MVESYLPIKKSIGYKNVKKALWNVFSVNLDNLEISSGKDENFNFIFRYNNYEMTIGISSTGRNSQFEVGEGGIFNIWFCHYVGKRFVVTFLYKILGDISIKRVFGKDEKSVENALWKLKSYLDSEKAKTELLEYGIDML